MAHINAITPNFYKNLISVSSIVVGVLYLETHLTTTIKDAIEPLTKKVESTENRINVIEPKVLLNEYKLSVQEEKIKEILKPEEPRVPKRK